MKFCVPLLLLLLFDTLQGSTLPHVRKVRALNTTLQTNFNGTYERRNPCTNAEIESTSYIASHEFHHHTHEDNWSDYTNKCSAIISGFLQAIGNLVRFNNNQNGLFNFHINTSISQKQVGEHEPGACCESVPTILIEATDCQVNPNTQKEEEKAVIEAKYDGPVCLLHKRNRPAPVTVPSIACNEQNADKINAPITFSNSEIPQNEYHETPESLDDLWNPIKTSFGETIKPSNVEYSQTVPNGIEERIQTTYEQTSPEFETPTALLPEPEPQVISDTISYEVSEPNFDLENSQGFQPTAFENANEQANFNPPAPVPNTPYSPQPSFDGIPPESVVSVTNEELIIRNQSPPGLSNEQGLPSVYPQQPSNENLDEQVSGPLPREPLPDSYPNQTPVSLPPYQTEVNPQGGPGYPQNAPTFEPIYTGQNSNLGFSGNYPPTPEQAPSLRSSFELPPPESNTNPSEVGLTETQASGQISGTAQTPENNFTPDQQQTIAIEKVETVYYNDEPRNYTQVPTTPSPEVQPEFLPTESQQNLPYYPSEIATNEQPPVNSVDVLPPESVGPKDAVFSDSLVFPNGRLSNFENSFQPVVQPNSQPPFAPSLTVPQEKPSEEPSTIPPPVESTNNLDQYQQFGIPVIQISPNTNQISGPNQIANTLPINSFSNQLAPNAFTQPAPTFPSTVGNISPSNNFPEQSVDKFDTPQQPDSSVEIPPENTLPQPIPTFGPQPSQGFTGQLPENKRFEAVPQNFQNVPVDVVPLQSSAVAAPVSDVIQQTAVEESQFDYSAEKPESSVSELVPNNTGNQLSEVTTYDKSVLNSNNFQPETQSSFAEPSDSNLDYTPQRSFSDSVPATYKIEPETQSDLISSVQNSQELPIEPENFPNASLRPELPPSTPDVTKAQSYSEQTRSEFTPTTINPEFVNPPANDFQTVAPRFGPQFLPPEQTFGYDRDTVAAQQSNLTPEISNPVNQAPLENNPVPPVQQQPQFFSNQNGDFQQSLPESASASQTYVQTVTQQGYEITGPNDQPITPVYPQPPVQSGVPNYETQPPNGPAYAQEEVFSQNEFYTQSPRYENQQPQATPQSVLPYQPPNFQVQSPESQEQLINAETTSVEFAPNPPVAPEASDSVPVQNLSVEQQSVDFDESQTSQQNYPNPGFQNQQPLPVDLPATQVTASRPFPDQSDSNLNYDGVQQNGIGQPQPQIPDQFSSQANPNLQPVILSQQSSLLNSQNGINPNELQTFVPFQQTDLSSSPVPLVQTVPENPQVNAYPQGSAFDSTEISAEGVDNLTLNQEQPSGFSQSERQDINTQDQFPPAVPSQFATQSSGEATTVKPNPYQTQPSEVYFGGIPRVQTTDQILTSIDEYQSPVTTVQEPLNYFQEIPDDVVQTTPPPFQADQFLTSSQSQSEYVQNNAAMYSPNLPPRPQPQPSFDNLTEFPGDNTAGNTIQTPSPSEIKTETLDSRQTALTQTNIPDIDNTKQLDTQPESPTSEYLGPQIYSNFDAPSPAVNYPRQDTFPPTADSITRDMTYQTTNPAFAPSVPTVPPFGINPVQMVFNSTSSYFSTPMTPSEGLETQPFRQASALIASPQPQSTTVKYNQQIIIPQNQVPTAPNPQPQATLKYSDTQSGDNTEGALLDSVAWTSEGPQEAMVTTIPPQYQPAPLGSQFPRSNTEFSNENEGFQLAQKEPAPVIQPSLPPSSSFEQQGDNSEGKTTIVKETIATEIPKQWANSSAEDQLAYADKLLNNSTPIQQYDQTLEQKPQTQQIYFSPTKTEEVVPEYFVTPSPTFQQPLEIQNQRQIQSSSVTNSGEIENGFPVSTPSPFEQEIKVQSQSQLQPFTSTNTREVTTDSFVGPPPPFQPQIEDQFQPQVQSFPSTNMREIRDDSPVIPQLPLRQQIDVQPQRQPQPFSSTISRETVTDSFVSQPPTFQPYVEDRFQPQLVQLDSTNIREISTVPPVTEPPSFQEQIEIQSQPQLQPFSSTNIQEVPSTAPFTQISPYPQQITIQPQTELQYPTTIRREEITDVTTPSIMQQQIDVQPQQQLQSFPSSNMEEIRTDSLVAPSSTLPQQIQVQPQTPPQPYYSTISRETVTDSLASQSPAFQQQIEDQSQPQLVQYDSTNIRESSTELPTTPSPAFEQQTDVQSQTELQPFSSTITRETVTDSFVSQPPPFQPQTEEQPELQSSASTNTRYDIADSPATASPFYQQQTYDVPQTELQSFSSTTSGEVVPDSLVSPPPPVQQEIENQFQPQAEEFVSTNFRTRMAASSVTPPSPQPQTQVQLQKQFQIISSTNSRNGITDSPVTSSTHFPGQTDDLQQTQLTPLSSTISREIVTNSLVRPPPPPFQQQTYVEPPPPFQQQTYVEPPSQLQSFPSTNMKEVITDSDVASPQPFPHQTIVQPQTQPQSFSSTISRETITDFFGSQPSTFQPQIQDQPKPQLEDFNSTNMGEDKVIPFVTAVPSFQQQIETQSQPQLQPFSSTISRETVTDSFVGPPPSFQPQIEDQPQPQVQSFPSTNVSEIRDGSPITPQFPFRQQSDVQSQTQPQPFSSTLSIETVTDSFVNPPFPFQPQIQDQPKPQLEDFNSTNMGEDKVIPFVTAVPSFQQQIETQSQPQLQPFSSTISRETVTDSFVGPPPSFQPQNDDQPQPQVQSFPSTNVSEIRDDSPITPQLPFRQQSDVQSQTQPQPFSSTISIETVTDSFVNPPFPFQPRIEDQPRPQPEAFYSTNTGEDRTVPLVTGTPSFQQQTEIQSETQPQPFSSTISREEVTDSLVSQPPSFQPQIEVQAQTQPEEFYTTNIREDTTSFPTPSPLLPQQIQVQSQTPPQPFYSTISRETVTDSFVNPPPSFQTQIEDQPKSKLEEFYITNNTEDTTTPSVTPETQPQPFSTTISREAVTDSLVTQPPSFQPQTEVQAQTQPEEFYTTNIREDTTSFPTPSPPLPQQIQVQSQTPPQPFYSTISRETVTDSFVNPPPSLQTQIEDQPKPKLEEFYVTNNTEDTTTPSVTPTSPFQQQTEVQSQTELQYPTTTMQEDITVSPVTSPPLFEQQTYVEPPPQLQVFPSSNIEEIRTDSIVSSTPPAQQQIVFQPQPRLQLFPSTEITELRTDSLVPISPFEPKVMVQTQPKLDSTNITEDVTELTESPFISPSPFEQIDVQSQAQPQSFSSTITRETVTDTLVSPPSPLQPQTEDQLQPQLEDFNSTIFTEDKALPFTTAIPSFQQQDLIQSQPQLQPLSSTDIQEITTTTTPVTETSPYSQQITVQPQIELQYPTTIMREEITAATTPPVILQQFDVQPQPQPQSFSSTISRETVTDSLVSQPPPIESQAEVQSEPELESFSATTSSAELQQDVVTQSQRDQENFSSRNKTEVVNDSQVSETASLQGEKGQVQEQVAGNSTEVAADSNENSAAKLEMHAAQEFQTQRVRYTTTSTKEVITESFLPTTESVYAETGKDGQWKSIEITSDSEGNSPQGKKTTEVVEEILATDFPPVTKFSSLEDEFALADKLLNDSTPVLKTTSFINVSPLGESTVEKVVTTAIETQKPADQISVNTTSENPVPLSKKSARVNYDQVVPTQAPVEPDQVVASNPNNQTTTPRADRQSTFKSDLRPSYGVRYSKSGSANKSAMVSSPRSSPNLQNSPRRVVFKPNRQVSPNLNPLFQTLETHLTFPLQEPPGLSSLKFGPRRTYSQPRRGQTYLPSRPTFPTQAGKSGAYLVKFQNAEKAAQEAKSDPPVPVSNATDPSNGPDSLKGFENSSEDEIGPAA